MPKFALRFPYFIIMLCLLVSIVGIVGIVQMPVDLFPRIDMPVVVVATFYNGMPPQQIEADITNTFERFFRHLFGGANERTVRLCKEHPPSPPKVTSQITPMPAGYYVDVFVPGVTLCGPIIEGSLVAQR